MTGWPPSRTLPASDVTRPRLILKLADGMTYEAIKSSLQTTAPTISRWKQRFGESGIEGLEPQHKGSKPRIATPAVQGDQIREDSFTGGRFVVHGNLGMVSGFALDPSLPVITQMTCGSQGCSPGPGYYGYYSRIPVVLGSPLTLVANGYLTNQTRDGEATTAGQLETEFQFRFFEADGSTPIAVSKAPEPSTSALAGLALTATFFSARDWHSFSPPFI